MVSALLRGKPDYVIQIYQRNFSSPLRTTTNQRISLFRLTVVVNVMAHWYLVWNSMTTVAETTKNKCHDDYNVLHVSVSKSNKEKWENDLNFY